MGIYLQNGKCTRFRDIKKSKFPKNFVVFSQQVSPLYNELGWSEGSTSSHREQMVRNFLLAAAVDSGMEEAVKIALQMFDGLVQRNNGVSPNFRLVVYQCGIKNGGRTKWKYAWKMFNSTTVAR